jgi:uncharacterized protein DUF5615
MTVREHGIQGADYDSVFRAIRTEDRALMTLDHDFGRVLRFPPETCRGIVILELPARATLKALLDRRQMANLGALAYPNGYESEDR